MNFREIVPQRRLTYAHRGGRADGPTVSFETTVVFERDEVGTRVTFCFSFASASDRQQVMDECGAYDGAHEPLDRLADHLRVP